MYSSGCLTTLISVERCVCVTLPLKAATLVKTRTIAVIIVSIVLSLQTMCLLYPFELSIGTREDPDTGKITLFLTTTEFRSQYILLYNIVENTLIMIVIPFTTFTVVTIATAITVVQLKRAIALETRLQQQFFIRRPRGSARQDARRRFSDLHHLVCSQRRLGDD